MPQIFVFLLIAVLTLTITPPGPGNGGPENGGWISRALADDDDDDDAPRSLRRIIRITPAPAPPRVQRRPAPAAAPLPARAPNEILARGLDDVDLTDLENQGFRVLNSTTLSNGTRITRLHKPASLTMPEARRIVRMRASAQAADFNHYYRAEQDRNAGCRGADCPARDMLGWPVMQAGCGALPRIGMVDTGLNPDHAVFQGASIEVLGIDDIGTPSDKIHGTAVAALLVGRGDSRSPGLIPDATLVAVDAFHKVGNDERTDAFALIEALDLLAQSDVSIINLSLAGPDNEPLKFQMQDLERQGIIVVAAAGNNGPRAKPAYPAGYDSVIAVTAVDRRGEVYRRAVRGPHIDIAAPGVDVWTAASISGARTKTGTSFAAPFVTAAVALMRQGNPAMTTEDVRRQLRLSARDLGAQGHDEIFGAGLVLPPDPCGGAGAIVPASGD